MARNPHPYSRRNTSKWVKAPFQSRVVIVRFLIFCSFIFTSLQPFRSGRCGGMKEISSLERPIEVCKDCVQSMLSTCAICVSASFRVVLLCGTYDILHTHGV